MSASGSSDKLPLLRLAVAVASVLVASCLAAAQSSQAPRFGDAEQPITAPADLSRVVALDCAATTLEGLCKALRDAGGPRLDASPEIAQRRVSVFAHRVSVHDLVWALTAVEGLSWRAAPPASGAVVEMYRSAKRLSWERAQVHDSEGFDQHARDMMRDGIIAATAKAAREQKPETAGIRSVLACFDAYDLSRAAYLAGDPVPLVAADNQSAMFGHLIGAVPFTALPASCQQVLASSGAMTVPIDGDSALEDEQLATSPGDLAGCSVGIVAAGGLSVGIVKPTGDDLWIAPLGSIQRRGIPGVDSDDDMDPEVDDALMAHEPVDLAAMPARLRNTLVRFTNGVVRTSLSSVLSSIAEQSGVPVVADDFLHSDRTNYGWLLTDRSVYTLEQAVEQVARAYGHRATYAGGSLRFTTVAPGLDLRCEVPSDVRLRFAGLADSGKPPTMDDFVAAARLTTEQLTSLTLRCRAGRATGMLASELMMYRAAHLLGEMTIHDRDMAEKPDGLSINEMSPDVAASYDAIEGVGMPAQLRDKDQPQAAGVYLQIDGRPGSVIHIQLLIAGRRNPSHPTVYRFHVP